jgi:hypothetical protein
MIGGIILGLTLAAFLTLGIYALFFGRKIKYPKGYKTVGKFDNVKITIIVDQDNDSLAAIKDKNTNKIKNFIYNGQYVSFEDLKNYCINAVASTVAAYNQNMIQVKLPSELGIRFARNSHFSESDYFKNAAGYADFANPKLFGRSVPLVVVKSKFLKNILDRGQPVIHELIHAFEFESNRSYDHNHKNEKLWESHGRQSVESVSVQLWKDMK